VIVDNGSGEDAISRLKAVAGEFGAELIRNATNRGIATALNQGLEHARKRGCTHALLFDQDTEPAPHLLDTLRRVARRRGDLDRVAVIGINPLDVVSGRRIVGVEPEGEVSEVPTVITSGSLVNLDVLARVGPFRDDFFIDHVDEEYCLRARSMGYTVLMVHEPLAVHALGAPRYRKVLWRTLGTSNHSPLRRYYMTRNHIILAKAYLFREPRWVFRSLYLRSKGFILMLILDDDRLRKLRLMGIGLRDGLAGHTGQLVPERHEHRR
jgi:rhamnosyltransferase